MRRLIPMFFAVLLAGIVVGQPLSGSYDIPGHYATIAAAVADLNVKNVGTGGVIFNVAANHTETVTAPITIQVTGTAGNTIVFQKSGSGSNPLITRTDAGTISTTGYGASGDAIIRMEGTDYITFDGISLQSNNQGIEYGYMTHKTSATNGSQYVTIKNAVVTMTKGTSGMVIGIYIGNGSTSTSSATGVTVTALSGRNTNILITGNTVRGTHSALAFRGSSATGFADDNITIGASGEGNLLENYGGGNVSAAHGVYMIYATNVNISHNTFNNSGGGGSPHTSTLYGVFLSTGVAGDIVMNNNDITLANTAASSASQGLYSANAAASYAVHNNTFSSGTITSTGTLYLIYLSSNCQNVNVSGNQINGSFERSSASGTMYCYYNSGSPAAGTENIFDNNFSNITVSGSASFYGIYSSTLAAHTANIYSNVVSNISAGTGSLYGIYGATSNTRSIYANSVYGLNNSGIIHGIYVSGGNPALVFDNEVYNLTSASSSATTTQMVNGIYVAGGTNTYIYNNYISDLNMPNSPLAAAVGGICINSGTNNGLYYNTIFLNAAGSTPTFGTSGIFVRGTSSTCDFRNNIIVNKSTPGETGYTAGIRWAAAFNPGYYAITSNNNNIYAGEPDANHLIYYNGTEGDQTIEDYQLRVSPMEAASFSENPPFINSDAAPYDLHLSTSVSTQCESGGIAVTSPIAIDSDFDGEIRQGSAGYSGTGTAPDVGAHEFEGIPSFTCGTPDPGNTTATKTVLCAGESVTLNLENTISGTGNSFQWQSSPDGSDFTDIPDAVAVSFTTTPVAEFFYRCMVVCQNGPETAYSTPVEVTFASHVISVTPGTRCGIGTVELSAEGETGTINWYDAATGGNLLGTGNTYVTPVISETTTYYVADVSEVVNESGGKPAPDVTTSGTTPSAYGLVFTAFRPFTLNSFDVYPFTATAGNIVVELRSNTGATLMTSAPIPIPGGDGATPYTVNIGWNIPVGEGLRLLILSGGPSMVRESTGNSYPYPIGSVGTITSGYISGTSNAYYFMYNWNVTAFCESPRVPVAATVTPAPEIVVTATPSEICEGQSSVLLVTSANDPAYTYNWEPGSLFGATHIVTPLASQVYGVTATDNSSGPNDGCFAVGSIEVIVHPLPPPTIVAPTAAEVESGNILLLTASGGGSSASGQIGTGTSGTTTSTPYRGVWGGTKNQMIYTADELTAIGMKPGSLITAISFNATAFTPPYTFLGFSIAMKNTATSVMTTTAETGVTSVFGPVDYEVTETGAFTITHTLDVPFAWDGASNLLVETCFNNNDGGATSKSVSVQYTTTTGFSRTLYISKDNTPTLCTEPPVGTTTTTRPNIFIHHELIFPKTWTPFTYLYSDAGATIPYAGEAVASVYTKPMTSVTYSATSTTPAGCTSSASAVITSCPAAPANLTAVNVTSTAFDISWSSSQGMHVDPVVYTVDVATDNLFASPVPGSPFSVVDPVVTVSVAGLNSNSTYYYRIKATGDCDSDYATGTVNTCPTEPANLQVASITISTADLSWNSSAGAASYTVDVCTDAGFLLPIAGSPFTIAEPDTELSLSGLTANTEYFVRVMATGTCNSGYSSLSFVTCPEVPGSLSYANATANSFDLNWNAPSGGSGAAIDYVIDIATDAGFLNPIAGSPFQVADPLTTLSVTGLNGNTAYYVRLLADNGCQSGTASITVNTCPEIPAPITVSNLLYTAFDLSWPSSAGGNAQMVNYIVEVTTDPGFTAHVAGSPFTVVDPIIGLSLSALTSSTNYYYRVKAVGVCESPYTSGNLTTLGCNAPSAFSASATSANTANMMWTQAITPPPLGYQWEVRTSGLPGSGPVGLAASGTSFTGFAQATGLTASTAYTAYLRSACDLLTYTAWLSTTFTTSTCPIGSIPYEEKFDSYTPPAYGCLTVEDVNEDYISWYTNTGPNVSSPNKMTITKNTTLATDDWFYTLGLPMEAGHSYTLKFWYRAVSPSFVEKLKVSYGKAPVHTAMSATPVFDNPGFSHSVSYLQVTTTLTPTETGVYWIGFNCYSAANQRGVFIDDVVVCEGPIITGTITGPAFVCIPQAGQVYSIPAVSGATDYFWTVPSGASIVSGANTNEITVDFGPSAVPGNVTVYASNSVCGPGNTATLAVSVGNPLPVSVSIATPETSVCAGTNVTFTATPVNGGTSPAYQWKKDGSDITGATNATYDVIPADGEKFSVVLTSNVDCPTGNPATSNEITMSVTPLSAVSVTINTLLTTVCAGTNVTFTATPVNGGTTPAYQWKKDGSDITGATNSTYDVIPQDGEKFSVVMTSDVVCPSGNPATSNEITMTVTQLSAVSVSIATPLTTVCAGSSVTFTATPVNGGTTPVYQWKKDGSDITGATNSTYDVIPLDGEKFSVVLTSNVDCPTGNPATSNEITMTVTPLSAVSVSIATPLTTVCAGTSVTFTATPVNGGTTPAYQWKKDGSDITGATSSTYDVIPVDGEKFSVVLTSNVDCPTGNPATSNEITMSVTPLSTVSVSIATPQTTVCAGTSVTFTATPVNGGTIPAYQWKKDGSDITGATNSTYDVIPLDGEKFSVVLTSNVDCPTGNPATSNEITMSVTQLSAVSVSIATPQTTVCAGTSVTFTATPVNGGTTPAYQWKKDGSDITGATNSTYDVIPVDGEKFSVVLTSNVDCPTGNPATSNEITMTVTPLSAVSVSIATPLTTVCAGTSVTFTATPVNGGTTPAYQWKKDGSDITGATNSTYDVIPLDGEKFSVVLTSNVDCPTGNPATSNEITMTVTQLSAVSVSIATPQTTVCAGTSVTFTATPVNGGTTPAYQWKKDGSDITGATNLTYDVIPQDGEKFSVVLTSNVDCPTGNPATSNEITMSVTPLSNVSVTIATPETTVCEGASVTFTATPVNGGNSPAYQWKKDGSDITGATNSTYDVVPLDGEKFSVVLTSNVDCPVGNPALSNEIEMEVKDYVAVSLYIEPSVNPSCSGSDVTFTAYPTNGGATPQYQWFVNSIPYSGATNSAFTYQPANFDEVTCELNSSELCTTGNPATSDPIVMTVYDVLPVSVSIGATETEVCHLTMVTLTATPDNGGLLPVYQWVKNSVNIPGATNSTYTYMPADGDVLECVLTSSYPCPTGNPATSNQVTFIVHPLLPVSVTIDADVNPICEGNTVNLTAFPVNGGTIPGYQWSLNGSPVSGATSNAYSYVPMQGDAINCVLTSDEQCTTGNPATSNTITMSVDPIPVVSVEIEPDANPVCEGSNVTFTALPDNGGASPQYQWEVNSVNYPGATNSTFTYLPTNFDQVRCILYSSVPCAEPVLSDAVVLNVPPVLPVSVTITTPQSTVCEGVSVTLTAHPVNEGPAPAYQWKKNTLDISGATLSTYSYIPVNGDLVTCVLTSNAICISGNPATSNAITLTVNPLLPVSVIIQANHTEVCQGAEVQFTSNVTNGGTQPTYQWQVNSTDIAGATNATFSYMPANGDIVTCMVTSDEACATGNPALSNTVTLVVNPLLPVSATVVASANPVFVGTEVTFNASVVNGGINPAYAWFVNNLPVGSNTSVLAYTPQDGDEVKCVVTSDALCASGSPATSNVITMEVNVLPFSLHIQNIVLHNGETRCFDAQNTIIVAGSSSTFLMESGSSATFISGQRVIFRPGTKVMAGAYMHAYISNTFCGGYIPPMPGLLAGQDEEVTVVVERPSFRIFPNPTSAGFTIEQKELLLSPDFRVEIFSLTGEKVLTDEVIGAQRHVVAFADQPAGLYIVKIIAGDYVETIKLVKNR